MGCGTSMSQSQVMKQSTSPKKALPINLDIKDDKSVQQEKQNKQNKEPQQLASRMSGKKQQQQHSIIQDIKLDAEELGDLAEMSKIKPSTVYAYPVITDPKIFLFGQSADERKIVSYDMETAKFQIVSSRGQKFEANSKYQPSDTIFESSQQLQASHLYNRFSKPPYNFMYATYIQEDKIFMCGGINGAFQYISDQSFIYKTKNEKINTSNLIKPKGNNLLGIKFDKLEPMNRKRYSHMGVYYIQNSLGYIYVFGGRGEGDQILNHCEKYSLQEKKWIEISSMKMQRSTGFSLVYANKIYVFGGYTSERKRTKIIQVFDPIKDYWESLDVKLHRGIEAGIIFSGKPNEILIMGGNMEMGALKGVIKVNLAEKTYIWDSNMKHQRFLQKGAKLEKEVFIFGGDFADTFQKYSFKDRKWREHKVQYGDFISPDDINSFTLATESLQVKFQELDQSKIEHNNSDVERIHIFGNDQYPVILQILIGKWVLKKKAVPMVMRLRCHMGITKLKEGKYLLAGGIDAFNDQCSRAAYLYYSGTNNAIEIPKLKEKKYQFTICSYNQNAYVFGGKSGFNGQILSTCQKFDTKQQKWVPLPNLSRQRTRGKSLVLQDKILIWGGSDSLQTVSEIEIFDTKNEKFSIYSHSLPISSQITGLGLSKTGNQNKHQIIIFSYNDLLKQDYCHVGQYKELQEQKLNQSEMNKELQIKQINLKILPFNSMFSHDSIFYFVTDKGIVYWESNSQISEEKQIMKPQIIINQVQMLQYPIKSFSFSS